jgi:hypothetical protein
MLGYGGDVFLGMFDDSEYVNEAWDKSEMDKADDKVSKAVEQRQEYDAWLDKTLKLIEGSVSINELEGLFVAAIRKVKRKNDGDAELKLVKAKDNRKAQLETKK